jgi:hypothetical protein
MDLAKWRSELADHTNSGGASRGFNPDWAKLMCWTKPEFADKCSMRPLNKETSGE